MAWRGGGKIPAFPGLSFSPLQGSYEDLRVVVEDLRVVVAVLPQGLPVEGLLAMLSLEDGNIF